MNKDDREFLRDLQKELQALYWRLSDGEECAAYVEALLFRIHCWLNPDYYPD